MLADPICSMFIAALITLSVYPLMTKSLGVLMQRNPIELDGILTLHLQKIVELEHVAQVLEYHAWTLCTGTHIANIRIEIFPGSDLHRLHNIIKSILTKAGIQESYVELTLANY
jgi:zinc transporter 5/7